MADFNLASSFLIQQFNRTAVEFIDDYFASGSPARHHYLFNFAFNRIPVA
jgi:hypothetical protein